jgi:hypothetical protein
MKRPGMQGGHHGQALGWMAGIAQCISVARLGSNSMWGEWGVSWAGSHRIMERIAGLDGGLEGAARAARALSLCWPQSEWQKVAGVAGLMDGVGRGWRKGMGRRDNAPFPRCCRASGRTGRWRQSRGVHWTMGGTGCGPRVGSSHGAASAG